MMRVTLLTLLSAALLAASPALCGDIDGPGTAPATNDLFLLNDVYNYLNNVDTETKRLAPSNTAITTAGAPASYAATTNEIYDLLQRMPATGQTTQFRAGDDGQYEMGASASWTYLDDLGQETKSPSTPINSAFRNVVIDDNTNLMWVRDTSLVNGGGGVGGNQNFSASMSWNDAIDRSEALTYAGYSDWRLPNVKELMTIVSYGTSLPAVDTTAFPNTPTFQHWTSTTLVSGTGFAWYVNFTDGHIRNENKSATTLYARPVRGGK